MWLNERLNGQHVLNKSWLLVKRLGVVVWFFRRYWIHLKNHILLVTWCLEWSGNFCQWSCRWSLLINLTAVAVESCTCGKITNVFNGSAPFESNSKTCREQTCWFHDKRGNRRYVWRDGVIAWIEGKLPSTLKKTGQKKSLKYHRAPRLWAGLFNSLTDGVGGWRH